MGRLLAVARRLDRRLAAGLVDRFAAQVPNPRPGQPADHQGATAQEQQGHGPYQPVGQHGLQIPDQPADRIEHGHNCHQGSQGDAGEEPQARRGFHGLVLAAVRAPAPRLPLPAARTISLHRPAARALLLPVGRLSSLPSQMPITQWRWGS